MIPEIENRFQNAIVDEAARRFGIDVASMEKLGGFEAHVFAGLQNGQSVVLKVTHSLRRTKEQLLAEAGFVEVLSDYGCSVSRPIRSETSELVEAIPDEEDGVFYATVWTLAPGARVKAEDWSAKLFQSWGTMMAQIHEATHTLDMSLHAQHRVRWYEEPQLQMHYFLPDDDPVRMWTQQTIEYLRTKYELNEEAGLVHSDIHQGNFHLDKAGQLTLFDFDDCGRHPFVNDIAISAYYALTYPPKGIDRTAKMIETYVDAFFTGYTNVRALPAQLVDITTWIRVRHALLYGVFHQTYTGPALTGGGMKKLQQHKDEVLHGFHWLEVVDKCVTQSV